MSNINVGISQVDYTPPLGLPLAGNFRTDYAARGVHDPLYARAMVFSDTNGTKVAICSIDVCMFDREKIAALRNFISSECDIAGSNVLISATHTHSGPATKPSGSLPVATDEETEEILKKCATAVIEANKNLEDVTLQVGYVAEERISFNRRLRCKDDQTHMNWEKLDPDFVIEPLGSIDPEVITLVVQRNGAPKAAMVNFGLHPAVLAGDNWLYSADYPGYLAEAMARIFDDDFITMFCNGCCGNVNHIDYSDKTQGRGYQMTQRIGYMLAIAAQQAMKTQEPVQGHVLSVLSENVLLKRIKISDEQVKWSEDVLEKAKTNPPKGQEDGLPDEHYAANWLKMYKKQSEDDHVEVMTIRVGDVAIVGLPGEMFHELGLHIKKNSPAKHTIVIELANDAIGYMPTRESFALGGYEPTPGSTIYEKGSGEILVEYALKQLNKLFQ